MRQIQSDLNSNGVSIVLIGCATIEQAREALQHTLPTDIPGELYLDTLERPLYQCFGLNWSVYHSLVTPVVDGFFRFGWKGIVEGFRLGVKHSNVAGNSWQMGGIFVVRSLCRSHHHLDHREEDGEDQADFSLLYQHREMHPSDWPPLSDVLCAALGREHAPPSAANYQRAYERSVGARDVGWMWHAALVLSITLILAVLACAAWMVVRAVV